jgi:hypothetical protein
VTPGLAASTLRSSLETLLLLASGESLPGEGFGRYPAYSTDEVAGKAYGPAGFFLPGRKPKDRLVVGPDGLTLRTGPTERITVRYKDCVAVAHVGEGVRDLWSADGFRIALASELWKDGAEILRAVDAAIAPELVACDEHGIGALAEPDPEAGGAAASSGS